MPPPRLYLQPDVTSAQARSTVSGCIDRGQRLVHQAHEMGMKLADKSDRNAQIVVEITDLPPWLENKETWVRQTSEGLTAVLADDNRPRQFSKATQLLDRDPEAIYRDEHLKAQRAAVERGLKQLRMLERELRTDRVMVIHGPSEPALTAMFEFLQALELEPITWDHAVKLTQKGSPHNLEAVRAAMDDAQAIVALFAPDDLAYLRPELTDAREDPAGQPRPNVLLETGMAMALRPDDTIIVHLGRIRAASDLDGINYVLLPVHRESLCERLSARGCQIDRSSDAWRTTGDFAQVLAQTYGERPPSRQGAP